MAMAAVAPAPSALPLPHALTLPECIDVLEAHPQQPTLLAVCTYMLHASGRKTGSIGLLRHAAAPRLALACAPLATAAVFDGHWGSSSSSSSSSSRGALSP